MNDLNVAWAAGLFEGEGSIVRRKKDCDYAWQLEMSSTDEDVIKKFVDVIGVVKMYGPYGYVNGKSLRREHHKPYWKWSVSDKTGIEVVGLLVGPYLLSRRKAKLEECLAGVANTPLPRGPRKRKNPTNYPKPTGFDN